MIQPSAYGDAIAFAIEGMLLRLPPHARLATLCVVAVAELEAMPAGERVAMLATFTDELRATLAEGVAPPDAGGVIYLSNYRRRRATV